MCGNGICAVAFCVTELGVGSKRQDTNITVSVCGTRYKVKVHGASVTAEFPSPELHEDGVISTGNKHVIMPMERLSEAASISRMYNECNIHFVSVVRDGEIRLKTFERGVGWTSACGSGAVASVFATIKKGMVKVTHTGGVSFVNALDDCVTLTVQPKVTFRGVWYESNIS
jgi:diaminopimelate epimerase